MPRHRRGHTGLSLPSPDVAVAHQFLLFLVPETEGERLPARPEAKGLYGRKHSMRLVTFLEIIVGNARAEMVHMVEADVARTDGPVF